MKKITNRMKNLVLMKFLMLISKEIIAFNAV